MLQVSALGGIREIQGSVNAMKTIGHMQQIIDIKHVIFTFEYFSTKDVLNNLSDMCTHTSD